MRHLLLSLLFPLFLVADTLTFEHIETTLLSQKEHLPVTVELSLALEGDNLAKERLRLMDVIQTALGAFWAESLATAEGKARLKAAIVKLAGERYNVGVDFVYLTALRVDTDSLLRCRKLLENLPASRR
ncbi:MAG: hypothetical protein GXO33_01120 [Epsilonproteobacteria bacterium]|nr:hypothetical protein [Campylobacterota bacterium]